MNDNLDNLIVNTKDKEEHNKSEDRKYCFSYLASSQQNRLRLVTRLQLRGGLLNHVSDGVPEQVTWEWQ